MTTFLLSRKLKSLIKKVVYKHKTHSIQEILTLLQEDNDYIKERSFFLSIYETIEDKDTILQDEIEDEIKRHLLEKIESR